MIGKRLIAAYLISAIVITPFPAIVAAAPQTLVLENMAPKDVIQFYRRNDPVQAEDLFTLALALLASGEKLAALESANRALVLFDVPEKKAVCYQLIAQAYGALGEYRSAAMAATEGQKLAPQSRELAAYRVAYWKPPGSKEPLDPIGYAMAREHSMLLDPIQGREPKMEPMTAGVIIYVTGVIVLALMAHNEKDPELRQKYAEALVGLLKVAAPLGMISPRLKK